MITRRTFLPAGIAFCALAIPKNRSEAQTMTTTQEIDWRNLPDAEWKNRLTPEQYNILRKHGTERAGTSALNQEKRKGTFECAGCALPLYSSDTKFESGTGWPSFYQPLENAVGTTSDRTFGMVRTEVHCRRCGGHLGHVFDDGPKPTGLRYCMDGFALVFHAAGPQAS